MGYSIDNSTKQINLVRGDTLKLQIQVLINGEVYTPRVGDSLRFAMKRDYSTSKVLVQKEIPVDTCILHLEPNDTKRLYSGTYVYDVQITFENGDVDTFIRGNIVIEPQVK